MSKTESLREIDRRVAVELGYEESGIDIDFILQSFPFSRAASAADVVRQEIERRGWAWSLIMATSLPSYIAEVMVVPRETNTWLDPFDFAGDGGTWMEALCTAFLAACDGVKIGGEL